MPINSQIAQKGRGIGRGFLLGVVGIVILAGAAFGAWRYYNGGDKSVVPLVVETVGKGNTAEMVEPLPEEVQEAARRITQELEILRTLRPLDVKFFEDPRLGALVQTPVDVPPAKPVARKFSLTPIGRAQPQLTPSPSPQPKPRGF